MKLMDYKNIIDSFFYDEKIFLPKRKSLIVLLGSFADFDSFEYAQQLAIKLDDLAHNSIDLKIIGIGDENSKEYFCKFNKIEPKYVKAVINADLHEMLCLNKGFVSPLPPLINLLIMCAGINSKGTIMEVLRGYLGDKNSKGIFKSDEEVKIGPFFNFKGKMFDKFFRNDTLRPFELATRRLLNMIEILSNWNIYVPNSSFLTQRGATLFFNENNDLLYIFKSQSLLGYSNKMSSPLSFLNKYFD